MYAVITVDTKERLTVKYNGAQVNGLVVTTNENSNEKDISIRIEGDSEMELRMKSMFVFEGLEGIGSITKASEIFYFKKLVERITSSLKDESSKSVSMGLRMTICWELFE